MNFINNLANQQFRQRECSVVAQGMNLCPKEINEAQSQMNGTLVNLWYHRNILYSNELEPDEIDFFEKVVIFLVNCLLFRAKKLIKTLSLVANLLALEIYVKTFQIVINKQNKYYQFYTRTIFNYRLDQLFRATWVYNTYNTSLIIAAPGQQIIKDTYLSIIGIIQSFTDLKIYRSFDYTKVNFTICIPGQHRVSYDPRCRVWYKEALASEGQVFVEPYQFSFDGSIGMTISNKILDDNGDLLSVISIDYEIQQLVNKVFKSQDTNSTWGGLNFEGYTVFFHENNKTIFNHKDWSRFSQQTLSWPDIEYPSNATYKGMTDEKRQFDQQVTNSIQFAHTLNYTIKDMENIDNFFQQFSKNGVKQQVILFNCIINYIKIFYIKTKSYSLIYPIEVQTIIDVNNRQQKKQIVMFVGRVHRDIRNIFNSENFINKYDLILFGLQTAIILFVIFFALMHYAAVLYYQVDIPFRLLKTYLMQELSRQNIRSSSSELLRKESNISKKKVQSPKSYKKNKNGIRKESNEIQDEFEKNEKKQREEEETIPQIKLFKKHKSSFNDQIKDKSITYISNQMYSTNNINVNNQSNFNGYSVNFYNMSYNQSLNNISAFNTNPKNQQPIQQQQQLQYSPFQSPVQQILSPVQFQSPNNLSTQQILGNIFSQSVNFPFSPNNLPEKVSGRQNPDQSINDSRFTFIKNNNAKQINANPIIGTYNQLNSTQNLSMTQQNLQNNFETKIISTTIQNPNLNNIQSKQAKDSNYWLVTQNTQNYKQTGNQGERSKNHSIHYYQSQIPDQQLSITRNIYQQNNQKYFQPIEINMLKGQGISGNKVENYQSSILKMNQSPRKKITAGAGRFFINKKIQEKKEQRSHMQMIAKQIRSIAIFSEKDMKEVLNIKLSDIPIMSHELKVIVSTFEELANMIEYLEGGYEEIKNEWEQLTRLRSAIKMFKYVKNIPGQSIVYQDIGNIYFDKGDYLNCIQYYEQSLVVNLQYNSIPSIQALFDLTEGATNDPSYVVQNSNIQFMQDVNLTFLRSLVPSLYIVGFAMAELGISLNPFIGFQNTNNESLNWLTLATKYLNTCFQICNKINIHDLKKIETMIFLKLTLTEVYTHLNDQSSALMQYKVAQTLEQSFIKTIKSNQPNQTESNFSISQITNFFKLIQGILLVKQGKHYLACNKFTQYLEVSSIYHFRKKALNYIKHSFGQCNVESKKIHLMERRIESKDSYDIFILFQSSSNQQQNFNQILLNSQNKNLNNNNKKQIIKDSKSNSFVSQFTSELQLNILSYIRQNFLKEEDKIFFAGYDSEFKVLQNIFPVENNSYWKRSEIVVKDFLIKNLERDYLPNSKQNRNKSTVMNNSNNNNNFETEQIYTRMKERFSSFATYQSRKDSNQATQNEEINPQLQFAKDNQKISWESSFFNTLKEMILHYKNHSLHENSNQFQNKKILLITFSFQDGTSLIQNTLQFEDKVQYFTNLLPKKPKIVNIFLPIIPNQLSIQIEQDATQKIEVIESQQSQNNLNNSLLNDTQQSSKSDISIELLSQSHYIQHNQPKIFPKNNKQRKDSGTDSINIIQANNISQISDNLIVKDQIQQQSYSTLFYFDQSLDKFSGYDKGKKLINGISTTLFKFKESNDESGSLQDNSYNKIQEKEETEIESQDPKPIIIKT